MVKINQYMLDLAAQKGLVLSDIKIIDGKSYGVTGVQLMLLIVKGHSESVILIQSELDGLEIGSCSIQFENKIRSALENLQKKMAS